MSPAPVTAPRSSPLGLTVLALLHYQPLHPYGIQRLTNKRGKVVAETVAARDANTATEAGHGLPRIAMLETEYQRAVLAAEVRWLTQTIGELRSGQLTWSRDELLAFAEGEPRP